MHKSFLFQFFIFLIASLGFAQENELYIKVGTLYDSEQNLLLKNKLIHIKGNKIISVTEGNNFPPTAEILDLTDYTVLPGLIDAHTHVLFSQEANKDFAEHSIASLVMESDALRVLRGAKRAKSYLDVGITSIKDLGNSGLYLDVALRDAINEKTIEGPRIFTSGPIICSTGGQIYGVQPDHQDLIDLEYRVISSMEDAKLAVREHVNQNVDLIKICADNLPNKNRLTQQEMKAIVETAHSYGLKVTAHSVTNQSAWDAVKAGVDGIEHGFNLADSTMNLMAKKNVFLVPTENSAKYMKIYSELAKIEDTSWIENYLKFSQERLQKAIKKGIPIIAGSDNYTPIGGTRGESSSDMFLAYFDAGMKPLDILQSATYLSALYMNKESEIGVLKAGNKADLIVVKGNIKTDFLTTLKSLVLVMKDGKIYLNKLK